MKQYFDVVSTEILKTCIDDYQSRESYQTSSMNKCSPGNSQDVLTAKCQEVLGLELEFCSGNFYKHSQPYLPHTDYRVDQNNTLNIVIPLEYTGLLPYLIVFDQRWSKDSVTWCMHKDLIYFEVNTGVKGCPSDYPEVQGLTNLPISNELKKHLTHYPTNMLHGLSGQSFSFTPNSIIMFDNQNIHCTSTFTGEKLGISLRFKIL